MSKINFVDGIPLEANNLNAASNRLQEQVNTRFLDTHTYGVVASKSPTVIVYTDGASLGIYGITAYDVYGNRIYISTVSEDESIPAISGLLPETLSSGESWKLVYGGQSLPPQSSYTLVIRYASVSGEPIAYKATDGIAVLLGENDSYELYLRDIGGELAGDISLATISTDINGTISVDESTRTISRIVSGMVRADISDSNALNIDPDYGTDISFEKHINSIGSGTISTKNPHGLSAQDLGIDVEATIEHQKLLHVTGLRSDNIDSINSAMYPYYTRETASSREVVYIKPLVTEYNEMLVVNGKSVFPRDFPSEYSFSFENLASETNKGYYLFYYNVDAMQVMYRGPFESEDSAAFVALLNNPSYFPICSLKWDEIGYDVTGDGVSDTLSYDIVPATFKDRREFNNTSLKNFRPDDAFALTQFAPVANDVAHIHNVRLVGSNAYAKYSNLSGKTFIVDVDGTTISTTFTGGNPLSVTSVVSQLITSFAATYSNGDAYLRAFPRIITENTGSYDDIGKLSISAPNSLKITANDAATILGFTTDAGNLTATSSGLVQEMLYYGERNGIIIFTYNDADFVTQIDYFLGGGKLRRNIFHYSDEYITRVEEIVKAL